MTADELKDIALAAIKLERESAKMHREQATAIEQNILKLEKEIGVESTLPARDWTVAVNEYFNVEFLIDGKVELVMTSEDGRAIAEAFMQAAKVAEGTHQ